MKRLMVFILSLFLLWGCGSDDLPQVETLQGFRVLAIIADNPEVAPNTTVNLSLLLSDVNGGGRTISGTWRACPDPGISLGAEPACQGVSGATAATSFSVDFTDTDYGSSYTGVDGALSFSVTVPSNILDNASTIQQTNGKGYLVVFRFNVAGKEVRAFKSIFVSNRTTKNSNPSSPTMRLNGGALTSLPAVNDTLTINNLTDEETFQAFFSNGTLATLTESYELAWYVSKAKLSAGKVAEGDSVKFETAPQGGPFVAVVVVRDERGGTSYQIVNIP
jgi:hypothetical protein